jgi:glutamate-1-semialdehyde 2,1-aminomutase
MRFATAKSTEIYQRACKVMPGGNTRTTVFRLPHQVYAAYGRGCRIIDVDGNSRIDGIGNYTAMIHGYGNAHIMESAQRQLEAGTCFGMATSAEVILSEILCGRLTSVEQLRYCNSGTEAVMNAIKAARAFTGRAKIAKCEGAYHGTYDPAETSQESSPANWGDQARPASTPTARGTPPGVLNDVVVIPFNAPLIAERVLRAEGSSLAAVLVDLMPNRAGLLPATPEFLEMLRRVTREVGALLIVDEVITFRLGFNGAQGLFNVDPDLTVLGKIIGGGFPVGAIGGRAGVMAVFDPTHGRAAVPHGGTFSANPMSMSCGVAALEQLTPETFSRLEILGTRLEQGLRQCFSVRGIPVQVTGGGSLRRVHLTNAPVTDYRSLQASRSGGRVAGLVRDLFDEGLLIGNNGLIALSTAMDESDIDEMIGIFERVLETGKHREAAA